MSATAALSAAMLADLRRDLARWRAEFRIARSIGQFGDTLETADAATVAPGLYPTVAAAVADLPEIPQPSTET